MATSALHALWVEPRPTNAPDPGPRDWALVAALICWSLVEAETGRSAVLRQDLAPRPLLLLYVLAVVGPLPWRRTHPLVAVAVSFGTFTILDTVRILTGSHGVPLSSMSAALILAYALFRWGSGREAASGLGVILIWLAITNVADPMSLLGTVGDYGFFLFAAALGAAVRYLTKSRIRDIDQAKAREREQLARELHDTVAHHVSGIAIQAQAGRAIAASSPDRAIEALAVIEDAATRTLTELRAIVGVLRASQDTDAVTGDADQVRLTVDDDGSAAGGRAPAGYGLVGMRERAALLGGTFSAGPAAERGWRVEAVLPRTGRPR